MYVVCCSGSRISYGSTRFHPVPPGSTYFTRVDAVTTGQVGRLKMHTLHARGSARTPFASRAELTEQTATSEAAAVAYGASLSNEGPTMFDAEKVVDHKQILEDEILRTRCGKKGALIGCAHGHLWSL